jgi:large subunit ribosomal protein L3
MAQYFHYEMKFILGTKQQMTQTFDENGRVFPVTLIAAGPVTILQVKSKETDGYDAVQVGFGERKEKNVSKALKGHLRGNGFFRHIKEFKVPDSSRFKVGDIIDISAFESGEKVRVSGTSKGKGFQGVVKRHGFAGGRRTHGQKHSEREPGSIGAGGIQRVMKGKRMAGRMGSDRITQKNLKIVSIDPVNNLVTIKGALPGRRGSLVEIIA